MKSLLVILFTVGCATSASIELRGKYGKDAASWCNKLSKGFLVDEVVFVGHGAWTTEELPGSLDRSLPSIAKFDKAVLDGFMKSINATNSWTTGTYTVDCANATTFPIFRVMTDFDELSFTANDYVDLKNAKVGQCKVLLLPGAPSTFTFGNLTWQKYCGAGSNGQTVLNH